MEEYREFSAKTVDEAITKAMEALETSSEMLDYEVIEEGSSGFLGLLGARSAVIRARRRVEEEDLLAEAEAAGRTRRSETAPKAEKEDRSFEKKNAERRPEKKERFEKKREEKREEKIGKAEAVPAASEVTAPEAVPAEPKEIPDTAAEEAAAKAFLTGVFEAMKLPVEIVTSYNAEEESLNVELNGDDMGVLIGKRGQTLDSLQYLTSLVVNKGRGEYLRVKLDTENYRERRKETLENLAHNISHKVKRTHKSVALEPMNPYERRVIHSALQNDRFVTTRSEGEEPFRHVVVIPKKDRPERKKQED